MKGEIKSISLTMDEYGILKTTSCNSTHAKERRRPCRQAYIFKLSGRPTIVFELICKKTKELSTSRTRKGVSKECQVANCCGES